MKLKAIKPYAMVAPAIAVFSVFYLYPIINMLYLSFFKWNMMGPKKFIGFKNFSTLFTSSDFRQVVFNSMAYMALNVALSLILSLCVALFLQRNTAFRAFLQATIFAPYIVSLVSVAFLWMWFMDADYGLLNYLLGLIGIAPIGWLSDKHTALLSLVIVAVWKNLGFDTVIFVSALRTIPAYLYEAAALDKGSPLTVFRKITLPMISPTLFFLALTNGIASMKVFETIALMTKGGPINSTNTFVFYLYENGFEFFKIGYASAVGVVLMFVLGLLTFVYFQMLSRKVHYR
jgi:sn-glycerol 3-phosphate transport system permease protein